MKEKWVGHGVEDHEVHDGDDIYVGFRLVEAPMQDVESPISPIRQCASWEVWVGWDRVAY